MEESTEDKVGEYNETREQFSINECVQNSEFTKSKKYNLLGEHLGLHVDLPQLGLEHNMGQLVEGTLRVLREHTPAI